MILYNLRKNIAVIPMSTNIDRIRDNINIPDSTEKTDISFLDKIDPDSYGKCAWDPSTIQ